MSESGDYTPAPYWGDTHTTFKKARKAYGTRAKRSYDDTVKKKKAKASTSSSKKKAAPAPEKKGRKELVPAKLVCQTASGLIFVIDITASMEKWPDVIFSKLPYFEHELKVYYGDDVSISVCAMGDAYSDDYPVQIYKEFTQGAEIGTAFNWITHERAGGYGTQESYDLPSLYYLNNSEFPKRIRKPTMIFIGDEGWYKYVHRGQADHWARYQFGAGERWNPSTLTQQLRDKFSVYAVLKPYTNSKDQKVRDKVTAEVYDQWAGLIGPDHIVNMADADRCVDCVFAIMAEETGKWDYFVKELTERQLKDENGQQKIDTVLEAVHPIHFNGNSAPERPADDADLPSVTLRDPGDAPARDNVTMDFH